ncbi:hypothetical protein OHAE_4302 [Ochrobactrum soli]|uniref:Uncharacterized protein n=1 Tax=Ochrobactrum soli TaxID=2448455 RepID=A0A2P9HCE0_9HYPH|nr:hypothetical protein OHAE_4302 [[Ochrobactrum] soli]
MSGTLETRWVDQEHVFYFRNSTPGAVLCLFIFELCLP